VTKSAASISVFSSKKTLSASRKQLLELMQRYTFCRIENLAVGAGGEPVFDSAVRITQELKIGADHGQRPKLEKEDFLLQSPVIELFEHLERLGEGRIAVIEVRHGLPFRLVVEHPSPGAER
jgi:hypothetical protein